MMRIATFRAHDFFELERSIRSFPWELYLNPDLPADFSITSRKSMIYHTGKLREIFEKEIPGDFRLHNSAGDADPGQTLFIRNFRDTCTVSIDASGESLYKRGVRRLTGAAPMRETLAALILLEAGIMNYDILLDPMCGSGTFSSEGASIFTGTPPNADRNFPFMNWPSFKENNFLYIKKKILEERNKAGISGRRIITSDIDAGEVETAASNVPGIFSGLINPVEADFFSLSPEILDSRKTLIVLNPPYGKRIRERDITGFYKEIGIKLKTDFNNCGYAVIAPGVEAENALALEYSRKIPFMNGGIRAAVLFRDI